MVPPGATLVLGDVDAEVEEEALGTGARIVRGLDTGVALPGYQGRNFALAAAAAREQLGALDPAKVADVALRTQVPGRLQRLQHALRPRRQVSQCAISVGSVMWPSSWRVAPPSTHSRTRVWP